MIDNTVERAQGTLFRYLTWRGLRCSVGLLPFRHRLVIGTFPVLIDSVCLFDQSWARGGQDTKVVNEAGKAAHGRSPAAKPEEKNLITSFVVVEDEMVALQDIRIDAGPEGQSGQLLSCCAKAFIVKNDLVFGAILQHPEQLIDIAVMALSAILSGPIGKYNNIFWHISSCLNPLLRTATASELILADIMTD
jgi:hypothetical protein